MNSVHLIGTVKFPPRFNSFNSGSCKASAIIECSPAEGQQYPDRADVVAWDDQAMALADLKPGNTVEIHGRLRTESWDDKATGRKVYKMVVVASSVASPSRTLWQAATAQAAGRIDDGEIPF